MQLDPSNPVVALCIEGMQQEGVPGAARRCFERAWELRADDVDASIAAHFLARQQETPDEALAWNQRALDHARAAPAEKVRLFMASLHLNLGDSLLATGDARAAREALVKAREWFDVLPADGYSALVARGIEGLGARLQSIRTDDEGVDRKTSL